MKEHECKFHFAKYIEGGEDGHYDRESNTWIVDFTYVFSAIFLCECGKWKHVKYNYEGETL